MVKPINWGGMLEPYLQPLKERLGILPLGQYEDGSVRLAWPGLLADPVQHGMRAAETPIPPVNDDEAWASKSRDFFDAAGLATTGALGANMAGGMVDNALGSAGGKLTQSASDLPMDLASRMQRAREMGFDTKRPLYHGTQAQFDEFDPNFIGGNYGGDKLPAGFDMTPNRKLAEWHSDGGNVMELMTKDDVAPWLDATDTFFDFQPDEVKAAIKALGIDVPPNARTTDVLKQISDPDAARQAFIDNGVVGMLHGMDNGIAGDGLTYRVFDPKNIRKTDAAFDPSRSDSANLLAANAKSGAAVPLAIDAAESQDPQTLTTANILRLLRGQ